MFLKDGYRSGLTVAVAAALVVAVSGAANASRQQEERKLSQDERQNAEAVVKLVDEMMTGQAPDDAQAFTMEWTNDFMKAQDGRIYVPFTIAIDTAALTTPDVTFYLRVVSRAADQEAGRETKQGSAPYAFEDVWFSQLQKPESGQPYRISRAFATPAGDYDVYVAVRERFKDKKRTPKASVLKHPTTVPDYWNGELATSSVIVAQDVQQLTGALSEQEQAEHPYTIGSMQLTPAYSSTFTTAQELSVVFLVYNPVVKDNKPDIQVEYKFHQKTADGEKYFNRTAPTVLNADTLGPAFDLNAGYQLVAGQSVPLASFPPGDYRLEIEVQDKLGKETLTRDVLFTVTGS